MIGAMNELGSYIAAMRERRGYRTQTALAEAIGKPQTFVSRIERGTAKVLPEPDDLRLIARALNVPMAELLRAAGYLDPDDDTDTITIPADDRRAAILDVLDGATDQELMKALLILEITVDAARGQDAQSLQVLEHNLRKNRSG